MWAPMYHSMHVEVRTVSGIGPHLPPHLRQGSLTCFCIHRLTWGYNLYFKSGQPPILNKPINRAKLNMESRKRRCIHMFALGRGTERAYKSHKFILGALR